MVSDYLTIRSVELDRLPRVLSSLTLTILMMKLSTMIIALSLVLENFLQIFLRKFLSEISLYMPSLFSWRKSNISTKHVPKIMLKLSKVSSTKGPLFPFDFNVEKIYARTFAIIFYYSRRMSLLRILLLFHSWIVVYF